MSVGVMRTTYTSSDALIVDMEGSRSILENQWHHSPRRNIR